MNTLLIKKPLFSDIVYIVETKQNYLVLDNPGSRVRHLSPNEIIGLGKFFTCVSMGSIHAINFDWQELIDNCDIGALFTKHTDISGLFDTSKVVIVRLGFNNNEPI